MKYCFRCGKKFSTKSNLNQHLNKKKECEIKYLDLARTIAREKYDEYESQFVTKFDGNDSQEITEIIKCKSCNKKFKHKSSLSYHSKHTCKEINSTAKNLETKYNILKTEYEEEKNKQNEEINKIKEEHTRSKQDLENKIQELEEKLNNQLCQNSRQNVQNAENVQSANTINNGNINNVTIINNFGEEDLSTITKEKCEEIMSHEFDMIVKFAEYMHITREENRNIFIPSTKEGFVMTLQGQNWNLLDKKSCMIDFMNTKNMQLEELLEKYGNDFEKISHKRTNTIIKMCSNDEEERDKIKRDLMLLLFNNRNLVKQTFEKLYGTKISGR
jgi:hypothetical protein